MPIRSQFRTESEFREALRDWFAGMALSGVLASPFEFREVKMCDPEDRPATRVAIAMVHANRMMEARNA